MKYTFDFMSQLLIYVYISCSPSVSTLDILLISMYCRKKEIICMHRLIIASLVPQFLRCLSKMTNIMLKQRCLKLLIVMKISIKIIPFHTVKVRRHTYIKYYNNSIFFGNNNLTLNLSHNSIWIKEFLEINLNIACWNLDFLLR